MFPPPKNVFFDFALTGGGVSERFFGHTSETSFLGTKIFTGSHRLFSPNVLYAQIGCEWATRLNELERMLTAS
jgi:hypothetical protein